MPCKMGQKSEQLYVQQEYQYKFQQFSFFFFNVLNFTFAMQNGLKKREILCTVYQYIYKFQFFFSVGTILNKDKRR